MIAGCDDNKTIIPYLKEKKELRVSFSEAYTNDINFLFVIDISGSMRSLTKKLASNIRFFLEPIFEKYPYYNYRFAFTYMVGRKKYRRRQY